MFDAIRSFLKDRKESARMNFDLPLQIEDKEIVYNEDFRDRTGSLGVSRIPYKKIKSPGLSYYGGSDRSVILAPQYDHQEIETVTDIEGFFAASIRKKLSLFSKEGWEFVGPEEDRVTYIKNRMLQIERATGVPLFSLMNQIARNLVVHSNSYLLKVRDSKASGGKVRRENGKTLKPVAGYFSLPPETMYPEVDKNGNIVYWRQYTGVESEEKRYSPSDIVHIYMHKKDGYPLGVPSIVSGLDDIHALRHIEESIEVLIRKNLFPLILFRVGTPDQPAVVNPDGTNEVDVFKDRIADMPTEGALVVPERYDVKAIGSEGRAMRIEGYVDHFKQRVFADLDVSSVDMGIGETSSRSTASTLSRNLIDNVKYIQLTVQNFFEIMVIHELLLESTFPADSVLDNNNRVYLKFKEIDTETKTAKENHITNLFNNNMVTYGEARSHIGLEPLSPEQEEGLHWNKFGQEDALIRSIDESSGKGAENSVASLDQPENQSGKRGAPKLNQDSFLDQQKKETELNRNNPIMMLHLSLRNRLLKKVKNGTYTIDSAKSEIETTFTLIKNDFEKIIRKIVRDANLVNPVIRTMVRDQVINWRIKYFLDKLKKALIDRISNQERDISNIFDSLTYRTKFIYESEIQFAKNISLLYLGKQMKKSLEIFSDNPGSCESCKAKLTIIQHNDNLAEDKLPPHHPGCKCGVRIVSE